MGCRGQHGPDDACSFNLETQEALAGVRPRYGVRSDSSLGRTAPTATSRLPGEGRAAGSETRRAGHISPSVIALLGNNHQTSRGNQLLRDNFICEHTKGINSLGFYTLEVKMYVLEAPTILPGRNVGDHGSGHTARPSPRSRPLRAAPRDAPLALRALWTPHLSVSDIFCSSLFEFFCFLFFPLETEGS